MLFNNHDHHLEPGKPQSEAHVERGDRPDWVAAQLFPHCPSPVFVQLLGCQVHENHTDRCDVSSGSRENRNPAKQNKTQRVQGTLALTSLFNLILSEQIFIKQLSTCVPLTALVTPNLAVGM